MTPKEKAKQLYNKMYEYAIFDEATKQCSLILIDEILNILKIYKKKDGTSKEVINFSISRILYLIQVKNEIQKL